MPASQTYGWLRNAKVLSPEDDAFCKRWLLLLDEKHGTFEYGAMNRSTGSAMGRMALTMWCAQDGKTAERRQYAQTVWDDWWKHRDTDENTSHYNGLWLYFVTTWLEVAGQDHAYRDPGMKKFVYRFLAQASPLGVLPHHGDGCGWNEDPGRWIHLMEKWASVYKDGRFKWVAHRLFEYTDPQEQQMWQWGNINGYTMSSLMGAWLVADESIEETMPDIGSTVTYRKAIRVVPRDQQTKPKYFAHVTDQDIPNKLIFRTGWQPTDTYALVELCPPMGHGHLDTGSVNCLTSKGSVLLTDTPYLVKGHEFHNCFVVMPTGPEPKKRKRWGDSWTEHLRMKATVHDFHASAEAAYARVHITDYMGRPVTVDRRIWFLGDLGLWVHDTVTAQKTYTARIGPAWQTTGVYKRRGPNWVNTCQVTLPVAFIWKLEYMMQWENRARDLLVYFPSRPGARVVVGDMTQDDSRLIVNKPLMNNFTQRVWYQKTIRLVPGRPIHLSTVLVPHKPKPDASGIAERIESLVDTQDAGVIKMSPGRNMRTWVGINEQGTPLEAGRIATDARWFMVTAGSEGVKGYWLIEATSLKVDGKEVFSSPERQTVDKLAGK